MVTGYIIVISLQKVCISSYMPSAPPRACMADTHHFGRDITITYGIYCPVGAFDSWLQGLQIGFRFSID